MLLRSTLEKLVPAKADEQKLSDEARRTVYRGLYLLPYRIMEVNAKSNYSYNTKKNFPYKLEVCRELGGEEKVSDDVSYKQSKYEVANEMDDPEKLARANRIERLGRRTKVAVIAASLGALIGLGVAEHSDGNAPVSGQSGIENCAGTVSNTETLVAIDPNDISALQHAGETACVLAGQDYLVLNS